MRICPEEFISLDPGYLRKRFYYYPLMIDEENREPESKAPYSEYPKDPGLIAFLVAVLEIIPRASCTLGKCSDSELYPSPRFKI